MAAGRGGDDKYQDIQHCGELVKVITTALEAGSAIWDVSSAQGTPAASGLYIIVLEAKSNSGTIQVKKIKFAVIKQARDDDVIN